MRILLLDYDHIRHAFFKQTYSSKEFSDHIIIQAYDYDNAILEIDSNPNGFDLMFLDHDLSEEATLCDPHNTFEKTGSDIAKHIVRACCPNDSFMKIYCHSMNPWGRENMVDILKKGGFNVVNAPFFTLKFDI